MREATVTDALRAAILDGEYFPGERLVESQLTERLNAGRAAVRTALAELGREGLIEHKTNRGARVRRISDNLAVQIVEARGELEGLIAVHAARNATADELAELQQIIIQMRDALAELDYLSYAELNIRLHRFLGEISRHEIAQDLVENLRNRSVAHQFRVGSIPGRPEESFEQHRAIVDAVVARDENRAAQAMRDHLETVAAGMRRYLRLPSLRAAEADAEGAPNESEAEAGEASDETPSDSDGVQKEPEHAGGDGVSGEAYQTGGDGAPTDASRGGGDGVSHEAGQDGDDVAEDVASRS